MIKLHTLKRSRHSRIALFLLGLSCLFGGCAHRTATSPPAQQPEAQNRPQLDGDELAAQNTAPVDPAERASALIAEAEIQQRWRVDSESASRAREQGVTEGELLSLIEALAHDCLARDEECEELHPLNRASIPHEETILILVSLLGELGTNRSFQLLYRLDARGLSQSARARDRIVMRLAMESAQSLSCRPPTDEEVERAREELADFLIIQSLPRKRGSARGTVKLIARQPTANELADLAYFTAATKGAGERVGWATEAGDGSWVQPGSPNEDRAHLLEVIEAAQLRGDVAAVATAARSFLASLGYPGPLRTEEAAEYAWGGARYSYVMRDLAAATETLGNYDEAAHLYRRAAPGGGACGSSVSYRWAQQVRGVIRNEEHRGRCGAVVAERLIAIDGSEPSDYGTKALADRGYDVEKLYRGALATLNREGERTLLEKAIAAGPVKLRSAALSRLEKLGPEAWASRIHALGGLADVAQREAIPALVEAAKTGSTESQVRALEALTQLARRPLCDPCGEQFCGIGLSGSSQWSRSVRSLDRSCETLLPHTDANALAGELLPLLTNPDPRIREEAAKALESVGSKVALPALRKAAQDRFQPEGVQICEGSIIDSKNCRRPYTVREAAEAAIARIEALESSDEQSQ